MGITCAKQPTLLIVLASLLLYYGVGHVHCATVHENSVDLHSLLDFQQHVTNDPNGALSNWSISTHFCRWNGVTCSSTRPWRVTMLELGAQNLAGQISPSLGNLTFLQTLDLSGNNFHGPLPLLKPFQRLEILLLGSNLLQGNIPDALTNCSNLAYLDLSMNQLTGVIPPSIGSLSKLIGLSFVQNKITGVIPAALGNITSLRRIYLSNNQLNGRIPNEIWQMTNIEEMDLSINSLSGEISQTLNMSSLLNLSLAFNMLGNILPSNIGDALPKIQVLFLGGNMFKGNIPASIGNATGLQKLDLSNNSFTGQVPISFGRISWMVFLNLEGNELEATDSEGWEFLNALANCSSLEVLSLAQNQLQGAIPNSVGNLSTYLTRLIMGGNKLSGSVPSSIGKFHGLIQLSLDENNLSGTIEGWIGKLKNLQHLNLQQNNFIGTFSPYIDSLKQLATLSLAENKFEGFLPPSLGNLQHISELNLSKNNLQGIIPVEFGNLKQLTKLDLSSNKFSGEIPPTLGQCELLVTIQIDQNFLTGNIPTTFSKLLSLSMLNVSHNNLSGELPAFLNDVRSFTKLDLSYNSFEGEIPSGGIFDNRTIVSLGGNSGLCGGTMDLHMPSCRAVSRRARSVNYLVKILIPIFGFLSLILLVYFLLREKKSRSHLDLQPSFAEHFYKVTYKDLAQATRDFSEFNLIGRGSYGSVYRGRMKETKMEVAVKVFNLEMQGAERSFMSECEALRSIQHRNLLPIITACSTVDNAGNVFKALVYEFMPNGNLDMWLHNKGDEEAPKRLSLTQRISIVVNVADALDYLHHDCGRPTVHCDMKPSNILLDDDLTALLGDFGIARFYANSQATWAGSISSIGVKGTVGYIPPEYGEGGHATTSGDVYSFGIVLLEIFTSKRPTDPMFMDGLNIINFVENSFPNQIYDVIDVHLMKECKSLAKEKVVPENEIHRCLSALLQVALSCTRSLPSERLNMKQVASKVQPIKASLQGWKK